MNKTKTILVAPLNWGIGHATRCIPIIHALLEQNHKVVIASDGSALEVLAQKFPLLIREELPSYNISYPESGKLINHVAKLIPGILQAIKQERKVLEALQIKYNFDVVISDNRYGLHIPEAKTIFISHQIKINVPFGADFLALLQLRFIGRFSEVWIPDTPGKNNLSGNLSHNCRLPKNTKFIGPLSQFSLHEVGEIPKHFTHDKPFSLIVISGPEPQRTIFERMILEQIQKFDEKVVVVGGSPRDTGEVNLPLYYPFLTAPNLRWLLQNARSIIVRAGYSTVMDLSILQRPAILVPTPGQIEQEYLASHLSRNGMFAEMSQDDFNLSKAIERYAKLRVNSQIISADYSEEFQLAINNI